MTGAQVADSPIGTFFSTPFGALCRSDRGDRPTSSCTEMEVGRRQAAGDWRLGGSRRTRRGNALT